jgi:metacaspase-1
MSISTKSVGLAALVVLAALSIYSCDGDEKGYALSIGLNAVNPNHYAGWSGELNGCELDAKDMANIAKTQGLSVETLKTASATRSAILGKLSALAGKLKRGDLLVVSYSGHGGQIPDKNGDEEDGMDETWCLYDGELLDDELNQAWSKFQDEVRILVFSDSCHSGTVLKMYRTDYTAQTQERSGELLRNFEEIVSQKRLFRPESIREAMSKDVAFRSNMRARSLEARAKPITEEISDDEIKAVMDQATPRVVPSQTLMATYQQNRQFYDDLGKSVPGEKDIPVHASAILISGCQDDQTSMDIGTNGLFTLMVKQVWDHGHFNGSHPDFYAAVQRKVQAFNSNQSPFFYIIGAPNDEFVQQKPYAISQKPE